VYILFAPTQEERDLWVNGINRLLGVAVNDPMYLPIGTLTKQSLNLHNEVVMTEGNEQSKEEKKDNEHDQPKRKSSIFNFGKRSSE